MLIKLLGVTYSYIALPAMAIIAVIFHYKQKTKGSLYFSIGAIMTAAGSMFNQLFPAKIFLDQSGSISTIGGTLISIALIIHLIGFFIMVVGWGLITFSKKVV